MSERTVSIGSITEKVFSAFKALVGFLFQNRFGRFILIMILLAISGYMLYTAGEKAGAKKQLEIDKKQMISSRSGLNPLIPNTSLNTRRKSIVGNVTKVSDKELELKTKNGENVKVKLNKETIIYGIDRKKADYKAIKNDQLIYITATIENDKSNTAVRIRIQK